MPQASKIMVVPTRFEWLVLVAMAFAIIAILALPLFAYWQGAGYYLAFVSRILIFAIAATSLNFILGFGGMVSFGHAAFLSIGAYSVGIATQYGYESALLHIAIAVCVSLIFSLATGVLALRTRGVGFIMITLAFSQMLYFLMLSLRQYGGDEGLSIKVGSKIGSVALSNQYTLYASCVLILLGTILLMRKVLEAPFGAVLRGCRVNEDRMRALGYPVTLYKLAAYALSGVIASLAGVMLANLTLFSSPSYGAWSVSSELLVIIVLGGTGTLVGPTIGAFALLIIEDILKRSSDHWIGLFGLAIVLIGLFVKHGIVRAFIRNARVRT
jgi:branched-chain amino acid transport system permease protein